MASIASRCVMATCLVSGCSRIGFITAPLQHVRRGLTTCLQTRKYNKLFATKLPRRSATCTECVQRRQMVSLTGASEARSDELATFMENRCALVTGSTSGIGLGIAHGLASRGCDVIITGFGEEEVINSIQEEFKSKYSSRVDYIPADLTKPDEIQEMYKKIKDIYPKGLDILINNAGFQHVSPIESFPDEKWDAMIGVLLSAPFHLSKYCVPDMKERGWGRIINISSVHGLVASPNKAAYVSAKHGLIGLTKVIALENATSGITCNAICPGFVDTPILHGQVTTLAEKEDLPYDKAKAKFLSFYHPSQDAIGIDQISEMVVFLCSDAGKCMTGSSITLDGGWTAR